MSGSIVSDCLNGATFHCFFALLFFVRRAGLFINDGIATVVVPFEVGRGCFTAQIAVDALIIDVVDASDVFRVFIC